MKRAAFTLVLGAMAASIGTASLAQAGAALSQADAAAVDRIGQTVFAKLKAGQSADAVGAFFGATSLANGKQAELQLLTGQIDSTIAIYGPISACELVEESARGSMATHRLYLCAHAKYATRWKMLFVKTTEGWIGANLTFDDKVQNSLRD